MTIGDLLTLILAASAFVMSVLALLIAMDIGDELKSAKFDRIHYDSVRAKDHIRMFGYQYETERRLAKIEKTLKKHGGK